MRHETGLSAFKHIIQPEWCSSQNIKNNMVGKHIENERPFWLHPERANKDERVYHAMTRGWIANEIFRRVESNGRTMGEFCADELYRKKQIDCHIAIQSDEDLKRCANIKNGLSVLKDFFST